MLRTLEHLSLLLLYKINHGLLQTTVCSAVLLNTEVSWGNNASQDIFDHCFLKLEIVLWDKINSVIINYLVVFLFCFFFFAVDMKTASFIFLVSRENMNLHTHMCIQ